MSKSYYYTKKPENVSVQEQIDLVRMTTWGVKEIQLFFMIRQNLAVEIRNAVRTKCGSSPFQKNKVLVMDVLTYFKTTPDEQIKTLNKINEAKVNKEQSTITRNGEIYVKVRKNENV